MEFDSDLCGYFVSVSSNCLVVCDGTSKQGGKKFFFSFVEENRSTE